MNQATKYFSTDYFTARTRFRQAVDKTGGRLFSIPIDAKGPGNEDLTMDIGWFGTEHPKKLLLHSSGLHGVEAFAGSAIQLQLLDNSPKLPDDTALVLVHALNPYGMAWLRRVNENNVDLNRNFLGQDVKYVGVPEGYAKLDALLNPPSPPSLDFFLPRAGLAILQYGMPALRQAIGSGQYEYPKGIMFGGKQMEQGPREYQHFLAERLASVESILAIDVHTGLGKYGEDTLLSDQKGYDTARLMFGERVAPLDAEHGPAYLAARLGPRAIEAVRKHLVDEQWYMVRNAVFVLAGLVDPGSPPTDWNKPYGIRILASSKRRSPPSQNAIVPRGGRPWPDPLPYLPTYLQETVLDALEVIS